MLKGLSENSFLRSMAPKKASGNSILSDSLSPQKEKKALHPGGPFLK